jgi:hypothetical protein
MMLKPNNSYVWQVNDRHQSTSQDFPTVVMEREFYEGMERWDPSIYSELNQDFADCDDLLSQVYAAVSVSSPQAPACVETATVPDPFTVWYENEVDDIILTLSQSTLIDSPEQLLSGLNIACDEPSAAYEIAYSQNVVQETTTSSSVPASTSTNFFRGSTATGGAAHNNNKPTIKRRSPSTSTTMSRHAHTNNSTQPFTFSAPTHAFGFNQDAPHVSVFDAPMFPSTWVSTFAPEAGGRSHSQTTGKDTFRLRAGGGDSVLGMGCEFASSDRAFKRSRVDVL